MEAVRREDKILEQAKRSDYVRFTVADFYGLPRSRVVPSVCLDEAWQNGVGIYAGKNYSENDVNKKHPV